MLRSHTKTILEILGRKPIHPFPAHMAPGIALEALGESDDCKRVLDPMVGSGTVLAVARERGHRAIGVDVDPLAVLLAGVWTRTIHAVQVTEKAAEVLCRARATFSALSSQSAYPCKSDEETRKFIRYWFDPYARRQLASLSSSISRVRNDAARDALWCGFSRLIITKSSGASLAMDLSHSRPHREFTRTTIKPFDRFLSAVGTVVANCPQAGTSGVGQTTFVQRGDARKLSIEDNSIDLVLTSPPYLNAIDYMRCSKFSLVWMGHTVSELRQIRAESVGTEVSYAHAIEEEWIKSLISELGLKTKLSRHDHALLMRYVWDMRRAIAEVSRVLRHGGRAVFVVGDSMIRGTFVRNSSIIHAIAQDRGLMLTSPQSRILPANRRYLPPPKRNAANNSLDSRMRREVIVSFSKP